MKRNELILTPKQRIEVLKKARVIIRNKGNDFICGALYMILKKTMNTEIYIDSYYSTIIYIPELLHYQPKHFDRNKNKQKIGFGLGEVSAWFSINNNGRIERLRIIDMAINRIKSRSKIK